MPLLEAGVSQVKSLTGAEARDCHPWVLALVSEMLHVFPGSQLPHKGQTLCPIGCLARCVWATVGTRVKEIGSVAENSLILSMS